MTKHQWPRRFRVGAVWVFRRGSERNKGGGAGMGSWAVKATGPAQHSSNSQAAVASNAIVNFRLCAPDCNGVVDGACKRVEFVIDDDAIENAQVLVGRQRRDHWVVCVRLATHQRNENG